MMRFLHKCSLSSILEGAMRNWAIPLPRQDRRLRLGTNPGHGHHRQATESDQRRLRQLRHQVGLDVRETRRFDIILYPCVFLI